jgi:putative ABC transport system substrate-binding protein
MDRRRFLLGSVAAVFAAPLGVEAQQVCKVYRIGVLLTLAAGENEHLVKALDQGLRELGYVEGRNLVFERRFAEGQQERLPTLAAELVRPKERRSSRAWPGRAETSPDWPTMPLRRSSARIWRS